MQHPKKIVRTTKISTLSTKQQQSSHVRRVESISPENSLSQQKQRQTSSQKKSSSSLIFSKSSQGTAVVKYPSRTSKKESLQLILHEDEVRIQRELNQLKKMELTPSLRDKLFKLQKFDQDTMKQAQNQLSKSLEAEIKRFERIRSLDKEMSVNVYDTELLVKTMLNYINWLKNVRKQNLDEVDGLIKVNKELQDRFLNAQKSHFKEKLQQSIPQKKNRLTEKTLSKDLQTTINFTIRALSNHQYPQAKRQILNFIEKANKQNDSFQFYVKLLSQVDSMTDNLQNLEKTLKNYEQQSSRVTKNLDLTNKYIRESKWQDLEKLKIKLTEAKNSKSEISLSLLLQSIFQNNNKSKTKQSLLSKSKEKSSSLELSPDKNKMVEDLKRQVYKLKQELSSERQKLTEAQKEMKSLQKQKGDSSFGQKFSPENQPNKDKRQLAHLQQQKRSLQSKTRSLQHFKKTQQQKLTMLQKKNTSLTLLLRSKQQQLTETRKSLQQTQKHLQEALTRIQKLQQRRMASIQRSNSITSSSMDAGESSSNINVPIEELQNLQRDFNQLSKQRQEEEYNYLKLLEEKDKKISEYEKKLQDGDSFGLGESDGLLRLQLEEKDKELIRLKKQVILLLEENGSGVGGKMAQNALKDDNLNGDTRGMLITSTPPTFRTIEFPESPSSTPTSIPQLSLISPLQSLSSQILQIRALKHEQTLSQGFNTQFNNIQREQWREVSKKIKEYKKKNPGNRFINYLDEKHKHEFDLTEKLTDYEEKMLAIHNELYRVKSIVSGHDYSDSSKVGRGSSASKKDNKGKLQSQNWWENVELIHVKERTEFAKLFNDLIDEMHKFFVKGKIETRTFASRDAGKSSNENQIATKNGQIVAEGISVEVEKLKQQNENLKREICSIQNAIQQQIKAVTSQQSKSTPLPYSRSLLSHLPDLTILSTSIQPLTNAISTLFQHYQTLLTTTHFNLTNQLSQQSTINQSLTNQLTTNQKEFNQLKIRFVQLEKEKQVIEKNLSYKEKVSADNQEMKENICELENAVEKLRDERQEEIKKYQQMKKLFEISEQRGAELQKKLSTLELSNYELSAQLQEFNEMEKIFEFIMHEKILNTKLQQLPIMNENQATINKNPEIIREIFLDQIKKKSLKAKGSPVHMWKKTKQNEDSKGEKVGDENDNSQKQSPKQQITESVSEYGFSSKFSMHTSSRLEEHNNAVIQTTFRLFSKVNEIHIQYEDSLFQKFQESRIKMIDNNESLKTENKELLEELEETKTKIRLMEEKNMKMEKSKGTQLSIDLLSEKCTVLQKERIELQSKLKKLEAIQKELQDENALLQKLNTIQVKPQIILKKSSVSSSSQTKQPIRSSSSPSNTHLQAEQRKQIEAYRKLYPRSRLISYIQSTNKRITLIQSDYNNFQQQKQSILLSYEQLIKQMETNPTDWFKKFNSSKGKLVKGSSQIINIINEYTKEIVQNKLQIDSLSEANLELAQQNQLLLAQSKSSENINTAIKTFEQVIEVVEKTLQQKFGQNNLKGQSTLSKEKEELFTNEFYLKNLFEQEVKQKKAVTQLQSLISLLSKLFHFISLQSSLRQTKTIQQLTSTKSKLTKQKDDLNDRVLSLTLSNKQFQMRSKQLTTQNRLIKESLKKLQSSMAIFQETNKSTQASDKSKQYEILRLKQTISSYVTQQTRLQLTINKQQKEKKEIQRLLEKSKKQIQKRNEDIAELNEENNALSKIIESLKQQHGQKDHSLEENEHMISNLKFSYNKTEKQLLSIQTRIGELLEEKTQIQEELNKFKVEAKREKTLLQKQIHSKKISIQNLEKTSSKVGKDNLQLNLKIKHLESTKQLQLAHLQTNIQRLEQQIKEIYLRERKEKDELNKRIECLNEEKKILEERELSEAQKFRQKLSDIDMQRQKSKTSQVRSFTKDIEDLNRNYTQMIKNYEKEKIQLRQSNTKTTYEYQNMLKRLNQEKTQLIQKYENEISSQKIIYLNETIKLKNDLIHSKQSVNLLESLLTTKEKELSSLNEERNLLMGKMISSENSVKQLQHKLQLTQQRLVESEKNVIRLAPFERKTHQYENVLLMNNISISEVIVEGETKIAMNQSLKRSSSKTNSLDNRLKELETLKDFNSKLQQTVQKLSVQLEKQIAEKQFVKQQSCLNRQDYIKLSAELKEEVRHLREQNKILNYEKNILQNQLGHYRELIKQINERVSGLEEEIRSGKVRFEKDLIMVRESAQKEWRAEIVLKNKIASEKNSKIAELQTQLHNHKEKLKELYQLNRIKEIQLIETVSKVKEVNFKAKAEKQKHEILLNLEQSQLKSQIERIKDQLSKRKCELEILCKDLNFYKASLEEKSKETSILRHQLQTLQRVSKLEKTTYQSKVRQIQENMSRLEERFQENIRIESNQRIVLQSRQPSEIKNLKSELLSKSNEIETLLSNHRSIQQTLKYKEVQLMRIRKYSQQIQAKIDQKMRQISRLNRDNMDLDMKLKEIQRNSRFQLLELRALIDFSNKRRSQLEEKYSNLQKELQEGRVPFSPSSAIKQDAKDYVAMQQKLVQIQSLESQNFTLKKQLDIHRQKVIELQSHLNHSRQKLIEFSVVTQESAHLRLLARSFEEKFISSQAYIQQLILKSKQTQTSKSLLQQQIQHFNQEYSKLSQSSRFEIQKYKNSQRVLDHELIEYKSKLENFQECLKEERQKNHKYRVELQRCKREKMEGEISPKNHTVRQSRVLQEQTQKLRAFNHQLQKKLITKSFQLKEVQQNYQKQISFIEHLQKQISSLRHQNQKLLSVQQSNIQFINCSNKKLQDLFSILNNQHSIKSSLQCENDTEFDLLIEISNRIFLLVQENKTLRKQCHSFQQQLNLWAYSTERDPKYDKSVAFHLENLLHNVIEFGVIHNVIDESKFNPDILESIQLVKLTDFFSRAQKKLKELVLEASNQTKQSELIQRYEWSIEKIKKLIRLYLQQGDPSALQSLKQIAIT